MSQSIDTLEKKRSEIQAEIESGITPAARNRLGQFATPFPLALDILQYAQNILPDDTKLRFLDPAVGTGVFFSAFRTVFPSQRIIDALGFEIDPKFGEPALELWKEKGLTVKVADFTREIPSPRFNIIICNPPYVRHHHLESQNKLRLQAQTYEASGMKINGLAGLYCHFLGLSHAWMADDGIAGWLIPSEFMDVNYGMAVKNYLLNKVTLLHIHRFDPSDLQFADALVSSAVVWLRKSSPPTNHSVKFSFGGTLLKPKATDYIPAKNLLQEMKWTRFSASNNTHHRGYFPTLADFFRVKRGIATGDNRYFVLDTEEIISHHLPMDVFRPILPSPRYLPENEILSSQDGLPLLKRQLFLLDTQLPEDEIARRFVPLSAYLQYGKSLRHP